MERNTDTKMTVMKEEVYTHRSLETAGMHSTSRRATRESCRASQEAEEEKSICKKLYGGFPRIGQ